jgi:MOSC domain-containing protein YiiM
MKPLHERLKDVPQVGRVTWLGVRPGHGEEMLEVEQAEAIADRGLNGDVAARAKRGGKRQVTLLQEEHLRVLASLTGALEVQPKQLRRNVVVEGVNLLALVKLRFAIGEEVILIGGGPCAPCAKMDQALGAGGFQALRGHGGIVARVERGGLIRQGDAVRALGADQQWPLETAR